MVDHIKVKLERNEYVRFNNYCYKNDYFSENSAWDKSLIVMAVVFFIAFIVAFQLLNITLFQLTIAFIIASFLFLFIAVRLLKTFNRAIPDEGGYLFCEKEYRFDEIGLHEVSKYGNALIKWESFKFVRTDGDLLYLFIDRVFAIIIPARCFASTEESQQFVRMVKEKAINLAK
ncbi:YcxB family protein [Providencia stuartii]|uniref:YcxB family protein n=1 Tax=Providencia stuartii TaxID=588 RepID=UPI0012B50767|nr:YcxB family protein [Providencia stuartii]MDN0006308.1 YcxB family protein [Providencia stuartii]MTB80123.1 YcxB family protein [Providencia stuartii]